MRLTHRRCRSEAAAADALIDHLATTAKRLTQRADDLTERLRAEERSSGHLAEEIRAACQSEEYAQEAVIPEHLRERLLQAHDRAHVLSEHADALDRIGELTSHLQEERDRYVQAQARMLTAAHAAGRLARTYALAEGAGMGRTSGQAGRLLSEVRFTVWQGVPGWECQDTACPETTRELVWHPSVPERAHLVCGCGRIWQAGPGAVVRAERETRTHQAMGVGYRTSHRWSRLSGPVLEAVDRALPQSHELIRAEPEVAAATA
ncbi:hypothetical protein [Nocardiopsis sp. FIRDI 009]|uniref:hypothetical protein n=1 Tax=Nocardiopsis sp. FIRDI 009 TaxID=714197 RepID=UPI000E26BE6A|nr:hypothetical protein [Nocardiopsis sp. FIRDI 009]